MKWHFGYNGGLDFSTTPPSALAGNPITTDEGGTSICDAIGQLLFYTNGQTVVDRTNNPMPNGAGLAGHWSASQSALVVPFVGDSLRYYVFTVPAMNLWDPATPGLAYSVVDMSLNNGLGDVTVKNVLLQDSVTEKLTAVRHANGRDAWVLAHKFNSADYVAFRVGCAGVEGPVVSMAGRAMLPDAAGTGHPGIGCMDISPQGDRLVAAWSMLNAQYQASAMIDFLSFNDNTGAVALIDSLTHGGGLDNKRAYGVHFSPSGRYVYVSEHGLINGGLGWSAILQFDMDAADIPASEQMVTSGQPEYGSLQMAPDGRMYTPRLSFQTYVSCIPSPDLPAPQCGFIDQAASIAGQCTWGLPNHWDTYTVYEPLELLATTDTLVCSPALFLDVTLAGATEPVAYLWSSGETIPAITINDAGIYSVEAVLACDTIRDSIDVRFGGTFFDLGPDRTACEGKSVVLHGPTNDSLGTWSDGSIGPEMIVETTGEVWLSVVDSTGCVTADTVFVRMADCDCDVFIPNAFTPNAGGDGINDTWAPVMECEFTRYELRLFDRWGGELLATDDPAFAWDGAGVPNGVYAYQLAWSWHDGEQLQRDSRMGHVLLLR